MRLYRYLNAFSIDVVLGAIICSLFFSKLFNAVLTIPVLTTLALAVWSVYTIDHLWDAWRSPLPSLTFRHHLHYQHRRILMILLSLALLGGGSLIWYLPDSTRNMGIILTACILLYFLTIPLWNSTRVYHKELLIALVYSCGIILGPYSLKQTQLTIPIALTCGQFTALAFSNLLIFAYFDTDTDVRQQFGSLSQSIGTKETRQLIILLLILVLATTTFGFFNWFDELQVRQSQMIMAIMIVPLATLMIWPTYYGYKDRYRILGDITFFIPVIAL